MNDHIGEHWLEAFHSNKLLKNRINSVSRVRLPTDGIGSAHSASKATSFIRTIWRSTDDSVGPFCVYCLIWRYCVLYLCAFDNQRDSPTFSIGRKFELRKLSSCPTRELCLLETEYLYATLHRMLAISAARRHEKLSVYPAYSILGRMRVY